MASTSDLEKAVHAWRLYFGSFERTTIKAQQKLYDRAMRRSERIAEKRGLSVSDAVEQLQAEARRRGAITPRVGQDV